MRASFRDNLTADVAFRWQKKSQLVRVSARKLA